MRQSLIDRLRSTASRTAVFCFLMTVVPAAVSAGEHEAPAVERLGEEAGKALLAFLEYDDTIPLEWRTVEKHQSGGVVREKLVFRGGQGFLVPGFLEMPAGESDPHSCVLLLHGWSGSKASWQKRDNYISGGNVRDALLSRGHAVLALDAQCHGDRIAANDFAPVNHHVADGPNPRKGYFTQREIYTQTVVDYRRAIDLLHARPDIDAGRLGVIGYSMGGTQTFLLTAADARVTAAVAIAVPAERNRWSPLAPQNYVRGVGSRPLLMIMGRSDPMCPVESARQLFALLDPARSEFLLFDGGHRLPSDYVEPAVDWITGQLQAAAD